VRHALRQTRDTRGRPTSAPGILLSGRVPPALAAGVDKWAKAEGLSRSQAVRELVEHALAMPSVRVGTMIDTRLSIRLDLADGSRIGPGKIAMLEAIRDKGSISEAARRLGMSYRRAWMLVDQINGILHESGVSTAQGGHHGGGTTLTSTGKRIIELYHAIEEQTRASARQEFRAISKLGRQRE
jgi:molybdate transport system regulatory protein